MKLSRIFQVPLLSGVLTLAQVQIWNDGSSVSMEDVVPNSEEEEEKLLEWYNFLDSNPGLKVDTLVHLHSDQDFIQTNRNRARAAGMLYRSLRRDGDRSVRDDHPFALHVRKLKSKTGDMFLPTSKSLSKTKSPNKGCKSTKSPSSKKQSKGPRGDSCGQAESSNEPSGMPSEEPSISVPPSGHPSLQPSMLPSSRPSESLNPSGQPSDEPSASLEPSGLPSDKPSDSAQPSLQPSDPPSASSQPSEKPSGMPSMQPSDVLRPGCTLPNVTTNLCHTGNGSYVAELCSSTGSNCCNGNYACSFSNATICSGSSNGDSACADIFDGAVISFGSCNQNEACYYAGERASGLYIGPRSCNCESACDDLGSSAYTATVRLGSDSCNAFRACFGSRAQGASAFSFGSGSCNDERACRSVEISYIGDNSCNGYAACYEVGEYSFPGNISIRAGSCNDDRACQGFANNASLATFLVSVGNNACNGASQCSGDVATGGSLTCKDANGIYGSTLPDNAMGCG